MRRAGQAARMWRFAEASLLLVALLLSPWHLALAPRFALEPSSNPHDTHHHSTAPSAHREATSDPSTSHDDHDGLYCLRCVFAMGLLPTPTHAAPRGRIRRAVTLPYSHPHLRRHTGFNRSARAPPA